MFDTSAECWIPKMFCVFLWTCAIRVQTRRFVLSFMLSAAAASTSSSLCVNIQHAKYISSTIFISVVIAVCCMLCVLDVEQNSVCFNLYALYSSSFFKQWMAQNNIHRICCSCLAVFIFVNNFVKWKHMWMWCHIMNKSHAPSLCQWTNSMRSDNL